MLSKEEAREWRQAFWVAFKNSFKSNKSAGGYRVNWLNYRTGIKNVRINLYADEKEASVNLDFEHKNEGIRLLQIEQLEECRSALAKAFEGEELEWHLHFVRENGKVISRIRPKPMACNIYDKEQWDRSHAYLRSAMLKMDKFWSSFGAIFEDLQ